MQNSGKETLFVRCVNQNIPQEHSEIPNPLYTANDVRNASYIKLYTNNYENSNLNLFSNKSNYKQNTNYYNIISSNNCNQYDYVTGITGQGNNPVHEINNFSYVPRNMQQMPPVEQENKPCYLYYALPIDKDNCVNINNCNYANDKRCHESCKNAKIEIKPYFRTQTKLASPENSQRNMSKYNVKGTTTKLQDNNNNSMLEDSSIFAAKMLNYSNQLNSQANSECPTFHYPTATQSSSFINNVQPSYVSNDNRKHLITADSAEHHVVYKLIITEPIYVENNPITTSAKYLTPTSRINMSKSSNNQIRESDVNDNTDKANINIYFIANNVIVMPTRVITKECTPSSQSVFSGSTSYLINAPFDKELEPKLQEHSQPNYCSTQPTSFSPPCLYNNSSEVYQLPTSAILNAPQNTLAFAPSANTISYGGNNRNMYTNVMGNTEYSNNRVFYENSYNFVENYKSYNDNITDYNNFTGSHIVNYNPNFVHEAMRVNRLYTKRSLQARKEGVPYKYNPIVINTKLNQLIVNFLPQQLSGEEFRALFRPYGELIEEKCHIIYDPHHTRQITNFPTPITGSNTAASTTASPYSTLPNAICTYYNNDCNNNNNNRYVHSTNLPTRRIRRSKGYGFIYYVNGVSTEEAIKQLNGKEVYGRLIKVDYAHQQRSTGVNEMKTRVKEEELATQEQTSLFEQPKQIHPQTTTETSSLLTTLKVKSETLEVSANTMEKDDIASETCDAISNREISDE